MAGIAVVSLGHADPELAEVIAKQAHTLLTVSNIFYTAPQIELSVRDALGRLDKHLGERPYLVDSRPGFGDVGLWGQDYESWSDTHPGPGYSLGLKYPPESGVTNSVPLLIYYDAHGVVREVRVL